MEAATFRYEADKHAYYLEGVQIPGVTQMLKMTGWDDNDFYTEEGRTRGSAVHHLTALYDYGALDVTTVPKEYRGWILAYIEIIERVQPRWEHIEEAMVHPVLRFAGTPDRVGWWNGPRTILEIKTGSPRKCDPVQTALQAILASHNTNLPATSWQRLVGYIKPGGRFSIERHPDRRDIDEGMRVIQECCR